MFCKVEGKKNGYIFDINDNTTTDEQWKEICNQYETVRCVICNSRTSKCFRVPLLGRSNITINNKLFDGVVYINGVY